MATAELILESEEVPVRKWALPAQIPELDGIRGFAMLLALVCHSSMWMAASAWRNILEQGKIGVDLFFVLSGFLITGILLDSRHKPRAKRNFYVRRGLRIWPLYFAYLLIAFEFFGRMLPTHFSAAAYLLFIQNFFYWTSMGPFLEPTWSLAVEEQFYVVWPWIALSVRRETVMKLCWIVLALSPVIRCLFHLGNADPRFVYGNTLCRLDGIAMGSMIAAWLRDPDFNPRKLERFAQIALTAGAVGAGVCYATSPLMPLAAELRYSFVTIAFGGMLARALAVQDSASPLARVLRSGTLTGVGRISFGLYLFNLPIYCVFHGHTATRLLANLQPPLPAVVIVVSSNLLLLTLAALSWKYFESPILRLKGRLAPR